MDRHARSARKDAPLTSPPAVVVWEDGTVAMTSIPRTLKEPLAYWTARIHHEAICAAEMAAERDARDAHYWKLRLQHEAEHAAPTPQQRARANQKT
jgi:hypothetical protein